MYISYKNDKLIDLWNKLSEKKTRNITGRHNCKHCNNGNDKGEY